MDHRPRPIPHPRHHPALQQPQLLGHRLHPHHHLDATLTVTTLITIHIHMEADSFTVCSARLLVTTMTAADRGVISRITAPTARLLDRVHLHGCSNLASRGRILVRRGGIVRQVPVAVTIRTTSLVDGQMTLIKTLPVVIIVALSSFLINVSARVQLEVVCMEQISCIVWIVYPIRPSSP